MSLAAAHCLEHLLIVLALKKYNAFLSGQLNLCAWGFHSTCSIGPTLAVQNNVDPAALTRALLNHFNVDLDKLVQASTRSFDQHNDPLLQNAITKADEELKKLFDAFVQDLELALTPLNARVQKCVLDLVNDDQVKKAWKENQWMWTKCTEWHREKWSKCCPY